MIVRPGFKRGGARSGSPGGQQVGQAIPSSAAAFGGVWTIGTPPARRTPPCENETRPPRPRGRRWTRILARGAAPRFSLGQAPGRSGAVSEALAPRNPVAWRPPKAPPVITIAFRPPPCSAFRCRGSPWAPSRFGERLPASLLRLPRGHQPGGGGRRVRDRALVSTAGWTRSLGVTMDQSRTRLAAIGRGWIASRPVLMLGVYLLFEPPRRPAWISVRGLAVLLRRHSADDPGARSPGVDESGQYHERRGWFGVFQMVGVSGRDPDPDPAILLARKGLDGGVSAMGLVHRRPGSAGGLLWRSCVRPSRSPSARTRTTSMARLLAIILAPDVPADFRRRHLPDLGPGVDVGALPFYSATRAASGPARRAACY